MFDNIPQELRDLSQWVCWRFETKAGSPKATKVPYNVTSGWPASSTDANTWTTFERAVQAAHNYDGIGFVLSETDPYCFIDLDTYDPTLSEDNKRVHGEIASTFTGYAELSPSGQGLHLIVKGEVPAGRKRFGVEIYSSGRYMTMTGNVWRNGSIDYQQTLIDTLWSQIGPINDKSADTTTDKPETESDWDICERASKAEGIDNNGQLFIQLWQGEWQQHPRYKSQSEADLALTNIIAFYTQNRAQIKRIFKQSKLYRPEKEHTIKFNTSRALDNQPIPIDIDAMKASMEAMLAAHLDVAPVDAPAPVPTPEPTTDVYRQPAGLLGRIAGYMYSSAARPVPEIALAGAIALMSGICGRSYNIGNLGLNHYLLLLAPTGSGKESIASSISAIMGAIQKIVPAAMDFNGPGEIRSDAALLKHIAKHPSFITVGGEFGITLQQMASPNGSSHIKQIKRVMLDLFGKSGHGNSLRPTIYSDALNNTTTVQSPAFSFLGESVPESFYANVDENLIADGLLPRFTIIEYTGDQPPLNPNRSHPPTQDFVQELGALCAHSLSLNAAGKVINVVIDEDATLMLDAYEVRCRNMVNSDKQDGPTRHLWNRNHLRASKLAALYAIGLSPFSPIVTDECVSWACNLATHNTERLLQRFETGDVGATNTDDKQMKQVIKVISKYLHRGYNLSDRPTWFMNMKTDFVVPYSFIQNNTSNLSAFRTAKMGATSALRLAIKNLIATGDLAEVSKHDLQKRYGTGAEAYVITNHPTFAKSKQ